MTTVAADPAWGIAADSLVTDETGARHELRLGQGKLFRWKTLGVTVGSCGSTAECQAISHVEAPKALDERSLVAWCLPMAALLAECSLLLLTDTGDVVTIEGGCVLFHDGPAAVGSGGPYALGAMAFGATPAEAVRFAITRDAASGGRVHFRRLKP